MILFKSDGVNIKVLTPELALILYRLETFHRLKLVPMPDDLVITSINDSTHGIDSKHYKNQAIDIRSHNFDSIGHKQLFRKEFERVLGSEIYTVLLEDEGGANEHFHVQLKKGLTNGI